MLNNGVCDEECFTDECSFDYNDCKQDPIVGKCDIFNIVINYSTTTISSCDDYEIFQGISLKNIKHISGEIQVDKAMKKIRKINIEIQGRLIIHGYSIEDIENFSITAKNSLDLEMSILIFNETFHFKIEPVNPYLLEIKDALVTTEKDHILNADLFNIDLKITATDLTQLTFIKSASSLNSISLTSLQSSSVFLSKFRANNVNTYFNLTNSDLIGKDISLSNSNYTNTPVFSLTDSKSSSISNLKISSIFLANSNLLLLSNSSLLLSSSSISNSSNPTTFLLHCSFSNLSLSHTEIQSPSSPSNSFLYSSNSLISISKCLISLLFSSSPITLTNSSLSFSLTAFSDCNGHPLLSSASASIQSHLSTFPTCALPSAPHARVLSSQVASRQAKSESTISGPCKDGYIQYDRCEPCYEGTYIMHSFLNNSCFVCAANMTCTNQTLFPADNTYRFTGQEALVFRECPLLGACTGNYLAPNSASLYLTSCAPEYRDDFCHNCNSKYTKISLHVCAECPTVLVNTLILIGLIVMISFFTFYLVKTTVSSAFESEELYSIALKIFMNYCQVIYLCLQYKIKWPQKVQSLTSSNSGESGSSGVTNYYFSLKCLINKDLPEIDLYYYRLYFMAILPVILLLGSLAALGLLKALRLVHNIRHYQTVTKIIPFLLVYPTVISYSLSPMACQSLGIGKPDNFNEYVDSYPNYLIENRAIHCNWSDHYSRAFVPTMIASLLWGLAVPLYIFVNIYKTRTNLYRDEVKIKYGFMFYGYVHSKYYWEFVILAKKLFIITLTVVTQSSVNDYLQSTLVITFLVVFFIFQMRCNPYITKELNDLEVYALIASIVTILCGIIYSDSTQEAYFADIMLVIILVANLIFILRWLKFMFREGIVYLVTNIEFLRKRFYWKDGFDNEISKAFSQVKCIYVKEKQKLYTQISDVPPEIENYLGNTRTMDDLFTGIIKTKVENYQQNNTPIFRSIFRRRSRMFK